MALQIGTRKKIDLTMGQTPVQPGIGQGSLQVYQAYNPYNNYQAPMRAPTLPVRGAAPTPVQRVFSPTKTISDFAGGVGSTLADMARAPFRLGGSAALQVKGEKEYTARNAYEKFLYGDSPVKSFEENTRAGANFAQAASGANYDPKTDKVTWKPGTVGKDIPAPVAIALGAAVGALDVTPIGGGKKKAAEAVAEAASKGAKADKFGKRLEQALPEAGPPRDPGKNLQDRQAEQAAKYKTNPVRKVLNTVANQVYDPRHVEQRLDNATYKIDKELGNTGRRQTEAMPNQSLAQLRGRIADPYQPAAVRDNVKYAVDDGNEYSLNDIIKKYGKDDSPAAKDFETFRIYMDELEARDQGLGTTIPYRNEEMADWVDNYLQANPEAPIHNQALRNKELQDVIEKEQAGIIPEGSYEALSKRQYYTPRTRASAEDTPRVTMSGGVRSGQKGIKSREDFNDTPSSPLSLFKDNSINHERDLANQLYGTELRYRVQRGDYEGQNFREVINADTVIEHKKLQAQATDIRKQLDTAKRLRDKIAADRRRVSLKQKAASRTASKARQSQEGLKKRISTKLEAQLKAAETKLAEDTRKLIAASKGDREQILNDLADRDPQYDIELKAARDKVDANPTLTAKERRDQINYDTSQLKKKYPSPNKNYSRSELLEIAEAIGRIVDEPNMSDAAGTALKKSTGKRMVTRRVSNKLQGDVDDLRAMLEQARTDVADSEGLKKAVNKEFQNTTQYMPFDTQNIQYRVNGEVGKIEIPGELATNLSKQNESAINSILDKMAKPIADTQKLFWTGPLSPAFKLWNVLVKNPLLMTINANGVSGIGYNSAKSWVMPIIKRREWKTFKNEMQKRGMSWENAFQSRNIRREMAEDIARKANVSTYAKGVFTNPKATFKDVWKLFSNYTAVLDNKQRYAVSYGAYQRARRLGYAEPEALEMASAASAQVFGDFERVTQLARALEVIAPYTGATQAGTRALYRSAKTRPKETAVKVAILASGMAALAAYSMSALGIIGGDDDEKEHDYYKDMIDKGQEWRLDNNWVIITPGAKPNEDGEWSGIISIPLLPDIRPMNRAIWRSVYDATHEGQETQGGVGVLAGELFNQLTGDVANQVYDKEKATGGNPATGILPSSPLVNTAKTLAGVSTYTGSPLADDYTASQPRTEQVNKNGTTSPGAVNISKLLQGGLTPQQVDQFLSQMGSAGDVAQNPDDGYSLVPDLLKPLKPGKSLTEDKKSGRDYIIGYKDLLKGVSNEKTYNLIESLHTKGKNSVMPTGSKAVSMLDDPEAREFEVKLAGQAKSRGEDVNPLFDPDYLDDSKRRVVLSLQAGKALNPGDKAMIDVTEKQNPWLQEYYDKQSAFFDKINKGQVKNAAGEKVDKDGNVVVSGAEKTLGIKKPQATDAISAKFDALKGMTDPKTKAEYYKNNPELTEYLGSLEEYNRAFRGYLGIPQLDKFPTDPEAEKLQEAYFKLPTKDGKRGGNKSRSDFIKANPALADYWTKKAMFQLNEAAARARYEGEELDNDALKDAATVGKLADGGTGSGSGYGSGSSSGSRRKGRGGGSGGGGEGSVDTMKYNISTRARTIAKPKVTAKGRKGKKPAKAKVSKPKVTSKKSLV